MTAKIIDGKEFAAGVRAQVATHVNRLKQETDITPGLAVVLVGEDPASQVYVRNKKRTAEACGFNSAQHTMPEDTTEQDLRALIDEEKIKKNNLILVTALTPTPAGEGKTTVSIGLTEGLNKIGKHQLVHDVIFSSEQDCASVAGRLAWRGRRLVGGGFVRRNERITAHGFDGSAQDFC